MIHSGGNMMDRAAVSETGRRRTIEAFPTHPVISLPQTIFFTDTERGRAERAETERIYNLHPNLMVIARDARSEELAREMFPRCRVAVSPDFVLSLDGVYAPTPSPGNAGRVLLCLRRDSQSTLSEHEFRSFHERVGGDCEYFDTSIGRKIDLGRREELLRRTLDYMAGFRAVVTDRLHGLIFAVLAGRPCVVYPTIDHKLTAGLEWFRYTDKVALAEDPSDLRSRLRDVLEAEQSPARDWNGEFFDPLARAIRDRVGLAVQRADPAER
jgi:exopolysaccharide biosynthesis predicted pyruvyltransferase EpsI